jgi:hypothetical protein
MWVLCLGLGLHLRVSKPSRWVLLKHGITFKVDSSFKLVIPKLILTSTNKNFGVSLQYLNQYLPLPTGILGFRCNTYTHTCLYQLEFCGFIAIPTLILTFTN